MDEIEEKLQSVREGSWVNKPGMISIAVMNPNGVRFQVVLDENNRVINGWYSGVKHTKIR